MNRDASRDALGLIKALSPPVQTHSMTVMHFPGGLNAKSQTSFCRSHWIWLYKLFEPYYGIVNVFLQVIFSSFKSSSWLQSVYTVHAMHYKIAIMTEKQPGFSGATVSKFKIQNTKYQKIRKYKIQRKYKILGKWKKYKK